MKKGVSVGSAERSSTVPARFCLHLDGGEAERVGRVNEGLVRDGPEATKGERFPRSRTCPSRPRASKVQTSGEFSSRFSL